MRAEIVVVADVVFPEPFLPDRRFAPLDGGHPADAAGSATDPEAARSLPHASDQRIA